MKVLHLGAWGRNWGDRVIQWVMRELFREHVTLVQRDIQTHQFLGKASAEKLNAEYMAVLIGGGGLFWEKPELESPSGWQWQYDREFLDALDIPIAIWAVGEPTFEFQPPMEPHTETAIREVLERAMFKSGRTEAVCTKFGLRFLEDPGYVTGELLRRRDREGGYYGPEFFDTPFPASSSRDFLMAFGSDKPAWRSKDFAKDQKRAVFLAQALNAGWVEHVVQTDKIVAPGFKHRFPHLPEPSLEGVPKFLHTYEAARAVFSNRKHGLLVPRGLGVPAFSIWGSAQEVKDIEDQYPVLDELGQSDLLQSYEITVDALVRRIL